MEELSRAQLERNLKSLLADQQQWLALLERVPVPVVLTEGPDHRFELVNAAAREALGIEGTVHDALRDACPGQADGSWHAALDRVFGSGEATTVETGFGGAERRRLHLLPRLDAAGATLGVATFALDLGDVAGLERQNDFLLAELRAQSEALDRLNRDLELEAQQRAHLAADSVLTRRLQGAEARCANLEADVQALERELAGERALARRLIEQTDTLRGHLVTAVSSELRAPIQVIMGFGGVLEQEALTPQQRQYLERMQSAAAVLGHLVDEMFDLGLIKAGAFMIKPELVKAEHLLVPAIDRVRHESPGRSIEAVLAQPLPLVLADEPRVRQALHALLVQTVLLTAAGEPLAVRAALDGEHWVITVSGHGATIGQADLDALFEPLPLRVGVAGPTRTNLGLHLARVVVEAHGGSLAGTIGGDGSLVWRLALPVLDLAALAPAAGAGLQV